MIDSESENLGLFKFKGSPDPIHFIFKSMSKGVGSDIELLRNWVLRSTQNLLKMIFIQILSRSTMKNHFKIKGLQSELPLTGPYLLPVKVRGALSFG